MCIRDSYEAIATQRLLGRHAQYQCWRKQSLPVHWHYGQHPRVPAIVCQMDEGWNALPAAQLPVSYTHLDVYKRQDSRIAS